MQRDVSTLPLAAGVVGMLVKAGFRTVRDVHELEPVDLATELGISVKEAYQVKKDVCEPQNTPSQPPAKKADAFGMSALDMLAQRKDRKAIISFCSKIDNMFGGGVPIGEVTEFCGVPGVGKTQMSMQLAVDVQIPKGFGGLGGKAVYIDTEGSFVVERVAEMAKAVRHHLFSMAKSKKQDKLQKQAEELTLDTILSGIYFYRVFDYTEQLALVRTLPAFLKQHPDVRLVVIDSIAFHFRHDFTDMSLRARLLVGMAQSLNSLAQDFNVSVTIVNQVTTKSGGGGDSALVPALGESWSHAATNRVILFWKEQQRHAHLIKSPSRMNATVAYEVSSLGVRDQRDATPKRSGGGGGGSGGGGGGGGGAAEDDVTGKKARR
jgi:RAD51-like protein 2